MFDIEERSRCKTCAAPISTKALKCIKCNSYQDWRRYVDIGNISLALIIALLTVFTGFAQSISNIILPVIRNNNSAVYVAKVTRIDHASAKMIVTNIGTTRLFFEQAIMCIVPKLINFEGHPSPFSPYRNPTATDVNGAKIYAYGSSDGIFIEPDKAVSLELEVSETLSHVNLGKPTHQLEQYQAYCMTTAFGTDGKKEHRFVPLDPFDLLQLQPEEESKPAQSRSEE